MTIYFFTYKDSGMIRCVVGTGKVRMFKELEKAQKKYDDVSYLKTREKGLINLEGFK